MIGGDAPSVYLNKIQKHAQVNLSDDAMNALLSSHRIPIGAIRSDDFDVFYAARKSSLLALMESVMGKAAVGSPYAEPEDDDEQ